MGTNYYWYPADQPIPCITCGHAEDYTKFHIGKSSAGWCFSLHIIPDLNTNSLEDWIANFYLKGSYILDEYGDKVSPEEMMDIIVRRNSPEKGAHSIDFLKSNRAHPGPNNLLRHDIKAAEESSGCIKNGAGTWDLITGEFT